MKKYLSAILVLFALAFQACENGDHEPTKAGLVNKVTITGIGNDYGLQHISEVALVARIHVPAGGGLPESPGWGQSQFMLRLPFDKNRMTLHLPENPPQALFCNITKDIPAGFTISDPTANTIAFVEIGGCSAGADRIQGHITYCKDVDNVYYTVDYIYCDRPVKITGSAKDWWARPTTYDLKLEKGWNMAVERTDWTGTQHIVTITNLLPQGMKWSYDIWIGGL